MKDDAAGYGGGVGARGLIWRMVEDTLAHARWAIPDGARADCVSEDISGCGDGDDNTDPGKETDWI